MCRYECGTELGDFDEQQNKYRELSGTLHTRERCESLKNRTPEPVKVEQRPIEEVTAMVAIFGKLKEIDIKLDRLLLPKFAGK